MAFCKFAVQRLIPPGSSDPHIIPRIGILHVDAGNALSLYDFFKERSGGVESHFHVQKEGIIEQYRDTDFQADANLHANDFAISVETQGYANEFWTPEQLDSIKQLMLWCRGLHDIPLRKVTEWNDPRGGWGYHTLFGAPGPWTPEVKTCPGPNRIKQFEEILVPWMEQMGAPKVFTGDDRKVLENNNATLQELVKEVGDLKELVKQRFSGAANRDKKRDERLRALIKRKFAATDTDVDAILEALELEEKA